GSTISVDIADSLHTTYNVKKLPRSALSQICRTPLSTRGLSGGNSTLQEIPGLFSHRRQTGAEGNRKGDRLLYGNDPHRRRRTHLLRSAEGGAGKSRP